MNVAERRSEAASPMNDNVIFHSPVWTEEQLIDLLPAPQRGAFSKADGEAVVDARGRRVAR